VPKLIRNQLSAKRSLDVWMFLRRRYNLTAHARCQIRIQSRASMPRRNSGRNPSCAQRLFNSIPDVVFTRPFTGAARACERRADLPPPPPPVPSVYNKLRVRHRRRPRRSFLSLVLPYVYGARCVTKHVVRPKRRAPNIVPMRRTTQ